MGSGDDDDDDEKEDGDGDDNDNVHFTDQEKREVLRVTWLNEKARSS